MKLKRDITSFSTHEQNWIYILDTLVKQSLKIREAVLLVHYDICRHWLAEAPGKDPLGSSTESDTDGENSDTARLNRRLRQEQQKAERPEIIDETIVDQYNSSASEESRDDVEDCAERLRRIHTAA
jgi:hypothetical protein